MHQEERAFRAALASEIRIRFIREINDGVISRNPNLGEDDLCAVISATRRIGVDGLLELNERGEGKRLVDPDEFRRQWLARGGMHGD